ncbi:MAG: hypothetical protein QM702_21520 [Rubrivivax sp.]
MTHKNDDDFVDRRNLISFLGVSLGAAALSACTSDGAAAQPEALGAVSQALTGTNIKAADLISQLSTMAGGVVGNANPAIVVVQGYYAVGDGGGGIFYWKSSGLTTDGGTIFAASNGFWVRLYSGPLDIRWFGAKVNDNTAGATNTTAFTNAIAASGKLTSGGNPRAYNNQIYVPRGEFYLNNDLVLDRTVTIAGAGMNWQSILTLPTAKSVIVPYTTTNPAPDNENSSSTIRDLVIRCASPWTPAAGTTVIDNVTFTGTSSGTPGIKMNTYATLQNLLVSGFTGNGIEIVGGGVPLGVADSWQIRNCQIDACGGHGLYAAGSDAHGGTCIGLVVFEVGGCAIHDATSGRSTYVGCYYAPPGGGNFGAPAYHTPQSGSNATFLGCHSEGVFSRLGNGTVYLGGSNGSQGLIDPQGIGSIAFYSLGPLDVAPFQVSTANGTNPTVRFFCGIDTGSAFGWTTDNYSSNIHWTMQWKPTEVVWALDAGGYRASYLTTAYGSTTHPRGIGLQGFPEVLIGDASSNIKIEIDSTATGHANGNPGDRIYNNNPSVGGPSGWIWANNGGTWQWRPFGVIT